MVSGVFKLEEGSRRDVGSEMIVDVGPETRGVAGGEAGDGGQEPRDPGGLPRAQRPVAPPSSVQPGSCQPAGIWALAWGGLRRTVRGDKFAVTLGP